VELQRAYALVSAGAFDQARTAGERLIARHPNHADGHHLLATLALQRSDYDQAEAFLTKAIELDRNSAYFRHTLGNLHRQRGQLEAAIVAYRKALSLHAGLHLANLGLGMALRGLGREAEAVVPLQQYVARVPNDADALNELGLAFKELGELDRAIRQFRSALDVRPGHPAAGSNLARTLLLSGDSQEGWAAWIRTVTGGRFPAPQGTRALFDGKRVVVYGTEGVGDEVMFASCVADLAARAAEVTVYSDPRLVDLFQRSLANVRVLAMEKQGARRTLGFVARDEIHLLASYLPAYFRHDPESFPSVSTFLVPESGKRDEWRKRIEALGPGLNVGLSWRGGVETLNRARRSLPLEAWAPILEVPGVHWINLQHGDARNEAADSAAPLRDWPDVAPVADLDYLAAQIAALDLVISVDNSTVHLAGALGTPAWVLLPHVPDWRWQMAGTTTAWYRSMRLFRQDASRQWDRVVNDVRAALLQHVSVN
jgi:Flp pilus assembly protein TadD